MIIEHLLRLYFFRLPTHTVNSINRTEEKRDKFSIASKKNRQTLHHQLDEIVICHDTIQQSIIENKDQSHPLMILIDEWEQKSIEKIQQMAKETRQKFSDFEDIHKSIFSKYHFDS